MKGIRLLQDSRINGRALSDWRTCDPQEEAFSCRSGNLATRAGRLARPVSVVLLLALCTWLNAYAGDGNLADAWALFAQGQFMLNTGRYQEAIDKLSESLSLFQTLKDPNGEILCLRGLARCYQHLDLFETAIRYHERLLPLPAFAALPASVQEWVLGNLGLCCLHAGRYEDAVRYLDQTMVLRRQLPYDCLLEGEALYYLGSALLKLGQYADAIEALDSAMAVSLVCGDVPRAIDELGALSSCYSGLGDTDMAIELLEEALDWCTVLDRSEMRDSRRHARVLLSLGILHRETGRFASASHFLEQSAAICQKIDELGGEIMSLGNLALCMGALRERDRAISLIEEVLSNAQDLPQEVQEEWTTQWGAAILYAQIGQLDLARDHYKNAIARVEGLRYSIASEALRSSFSSKRSVRSLYEEYLRLLLHVGESQSALYVAECCRARTFLDLVAMGPVGTLENVAEEGIVSGVVEASVIESGLAEVVSGLPASTAALEYFVTNEATYLWLVRDGLASEPIRIEISRSDLREQVLTFRITLETSSTGMADAPDEETLTMSHDLYGLLITPVEDRLEGIEHLVIVPSGPLYYLPFCALLDCADCEGPDLLGGEFLIERFSLSYAPSLTILKYARASTADSQEDPLFLALADPDSGESETPRLPDAQEEATAVAGLFDASEVYVDEDATEEVVASRASVAEQLLLATHGTFNPVNPMFSYLLLSPTQESDGRLYTHEVFSLGLRTDLVTLSACETLLPALGEMEDDVRAVRGASPEEDVELSEALLEGLTSGDEIVGLTRALLYAGTPSVLSSLWNVVSETTEPLMVAFYGYLQEGLSKAEALRQAQVDVMGSYPHPRYWAAFCLVGDWR